MADMRLNDPAVPRELQEALRPYDTDGDGVLSEPEIRSPRFQGEGISGIRQGLAEQGWERGSADNGYTPVPRAGAEGSRDAFDYFDRHFNQEVPRPESNPAAQAAWDRLSDMVCPDGRFSTNELIRLQETEPLASDATIQRDLALIFENLPEVTPFNSFEYRYAPNGDSAHTAGCPALLSGLSRPTTAGALGRTVKS
ncbi:MAG: hypothetical protein AAF735_00270 [Myxococcota bacterium]